MMYMENSSSPKIVGKDTVQLKFTFYEIITLKDVVCVPDICKNFVSRSLPFKHGFKMV